MWWATIGAALISAAAAIIVGVVNSKADHKKLTAQLDKQNALHLYRIEQLEQKVDKHNNIMERTFRLEEKMKVANHRIDDLEKERR